MYSSLYQVYYCTYTYSLNFIIGILRNNHEFLSLTHIYYAPKPVLLTFYSAILTYLCMKCFVYIGNDGKQLKVHLPAATWYNWYTQNTVTDSRSTTITMDTPLDMLTSCSKHDTATFGGKRKEKWVAYETAAVFRCFCRTSGAKCTACL